MENTRFEFPSRDYGGEGDSIHFLHANGYPPGCYLPLLNCLTSRYHVFGMLLRPLWDRGDPRALADWKPLSEDLIHYLENRAPDRVIAVGHSVGAIVSLRAAIRAPQHFRALILIEPVLFPPPFILGWRFMQYLGLGYRMHPLIPPAQRRRRKFDDLEVLYDSYRAKDIFRYLSDENLRIMIDGMTRRHPLSGYELAYSPEWEVQIYYTGVSADADLWSELPKVELPLLIIRGAETDTFFPSTAARLKRIHPSAQVLTIDQSTHLVPLEKPEAVAASILGFLEKIQ